MNKTKFMLLGVGAVFSSASFLYEYATNYHNPIVTAIIMFLDIVLLIINLIYFWFSSSEKAGKSIVNAFLSALVYFAGLSGIIMVLAGENASLHFLLGTLKTLIYLSPIIVLLLPVIYIIDLILV